MARPTPYSRPHTSSVGLKSASHIARSRLAASAQQKTVRVTEPPKNAKPRRDKNRVQLFSGSARYQVPSSPLQEKKGTGKHE
ncbi:hypothetical protein N7452_004204 [Penicillium brevicompactum]|uniref:Uncharacterized protein n=1 Tax=Penicillium brevicompactum TaxID=5074 RepID=A0A9W9QV08_PENBR|nr:hypothetical protein N7452_004204 [Penicillium brevicompactum]